MAGHAVNLDHETAETIDRGDHADRETFGFQHRALFDVKLHVGRYFVSTPRRLHDVCRVQAELPDGFTHTDAIAVGFVQRCDIERSGDGTAAQQRCRKAYALLIGEANHFDGDGKLRPAGVKRMHTFDGGHHAEHAIVFSGVAYSIQM